MDYIEIVIILFVSILALIVTIYVIYFSYNNLKKFKEQMADNSFDKETYYALKEENKKKEITKNVLTTVFFLISIGFFIYMMVLGSMNNVITQNDSYLVSIESSSMGQVNPINTYLSNNNLTNQIQYHDIIEFDKVEDPSSLKIYDIILFEKEIDGKEILITHRIVRFTENGFITQGDANEKPDDFTVYYTDILGVYNSRREGLSLLNYVIKSVSFKIIFTTILVDTLIYDGINFYIKKKVDTIEEN